MAGTRILGALSVDADDRMSSDAHEPHDQLPLPTLDERASFYLRAVHGDRDFSSEEHANARDLMLDAMAADISARSERGSAKAVLQDNALLLPELEPVTVPRLRPDQNTDDQDIAEQDIDDSGDAAPATVPVFSEQVLQRPRLSWFSE